MHRGVNCRLDRASLNGPAGEACRFRGMIAAA
jgi:hypothetical protein